MLIYYNSIQVLNINPIFLNYQKFYNYTLFWLISN
nr:MAG TPA: hypothetical protein [Microviridae sp.]